MALRIRKSGRVVCAKYHKPRPGDCYIDDNVHYRLAVEMNVLKPVNKRGTVWAFTRMARSNKR